MLQELCSKLLSAALAAQELRLTVELEIRQTVRQILREKKEEEQYRHEWKLPVPTQDRSLLLGLVRLELEKTTFSAQFESELEVIPVKPRVAQEQFFAPPSPEAEKLEITLERIRGVVGGADVDGAASVGSPCLVDTHRPGCFTLRHFSSVDDGGSYHANLPSAAAPVIALRIFRPAIETTVELDGAAAFRALMEPATASDGCFRAMV